jgi:hypothetical protein
MKLGIVATGTIDLIPRVKKKMGIIAILFEDLKAFPSAENTTRSAKGFDSSDWMGLLEYR